MRGVKELKRRTKMKRKPSFMEGEGKEEANEEQRKGMAWATGWKYQSKAKTQISSAHKPLGGKGEPGR